MRLLLHCYDAYTLYYGEGTCNFVRPTGFSNPSTLHYTILLYPFDEAVLLTIASVILLLIIRVR